MSRFGLVAFVKARTDEEERLADAATHAGMGVDIGPDGKAVSTHPAMQDHFATWSPARARREAEAKRNRLALLDEAITEVDRLLADDDAAKIDQGVAIGRAAAARTAVELDAAVWGDHPDYRAEWKPRA